MTEPGFMAATVRAEISFGAAPPATRAAPITTSAEVQSDLNRSACGLQQNLTRSPKRCD